MFASAKIKGRDCLIRSNPNGHGTLLCLVQGKPGNIMSGYYLQLLDNMFDHVDATIGGWERVIVTNSDAKVNKTVSDFEDCKHVLLFGKALANVLIKPSGLKIENSGDMMGLLVVANAKRWISTPSLGVYSIGKEASWKRASLMGLLYRHLELLRFGIVSRPKRLSIKTRLISNKRQFDTFFVLLKTAPVVAIDTETYNLEKINNKVITIQFCFDGNVGYVLPITHDENPLKPSVLRYALDKLHQYFEKGKPALHVYHTAIFDLHQLINVCKLRWYNHNVYDICAGAYTLDENVMFVKGTLGVEGHSLARMSLEHGFNIYENSPIAKTDRARLYAMPLKSIAEYGVLDVVAPWHIMKMQRSLAKLRDNYHKGQPYSKFYRCVTQVIGRQLQQFVFMEKNGLFIDRKYLVESQGVNSPLKKEIDAALEKLKLMPECQKANELLLKKEHLGTNTLFGKQGWRLDLGKPEHKQILFFDVCKLKPLALRKDNKGKIDKAFQKEYARHHVVKTFSALEEVKKLQSTFMVGMFKMLVKNPDNKDGSIRTTFKWLSIITGRASSTQPNLQNIPTRSEKAKAIKRQFVSHRGRLYVKRDFSAHEIRGWGLAAGDDALSTSFWNGMKTRLAYEKLNAKPEPEWTMRLKLSDVHIQNYSMLYNVQPQTVTPEQRSDVKATIFGSVYGLGLLSLAEQLKSAAVGAVKKEINKILDANPRPPDAKEKIVALRKEKDKVENQDWMGKTKAIHELVFKKKFPKGGAWIERTKRVGAKTLRSVSPLGRVRHLYGYLHVEPKIHGSMDRRGPNSAVQGMCSDIGFVGGYLMREIEWRWFTSRNVDIGYYQCNTVHDSNESECDIVNIPLIEYLQHHSYTTLVHRWLIHTMQVRPLVGFEMDTEIGASLAHMSKAQHWTLMVEAIQKGIEWGNQNLDWDLPIQPYIDRVEHNAKILHKLRVKEIDYMLRNEIRVPTHMEMTKDNCLDLGLVFKPPKEIVNIQRANLSSKELELL